LFAPDVDWEPWVAPLQDAGYEPRVVELDGAEQARKVAAMRTYRTQFPALEAGGLRRLTHPALVRFELRWDPSNEARRPEAARLP
jgi:hypothetical protein